MYYPKIKQGTIVRSRKNTLYKQEEDFLAVTKTNERFYLSEPLADLLKMMDGTKSLEDLNLAKGYDCFPILEKLCNNDITEFNNEPSPNHSHNKQFIEVHNLPAACQTAIWHTTRKCNLKCSHCYYLYGKEKKEDFSVKEVEQICHSLADLGCDMVILSGGEILTNKVTFKVTTDKLAELCLPFRINTNGTLACSEIIHVFEQNEFARMVQLSVDGPCNVHDRMRGIRGSYQKTTESIRLLKSKNIYIRVVSMMTEEWMNVESVLTFAQTLSELKVDQWMIEIPSSTGRWQKAIESRYHDTLISLSKALIHYCVNVTHNFKEVIFNQVFSYPQREYVAKTLNDAICSHDLGLLSFGTEGVSYCTLYREQFGDTWRDFESTTHLKQAWEKISLFRISKKIKDNPTCVKCDLFSLCQGGCPGLYSDSLNFEGCDYHSKLLSLVKRSLITEGYDSTKISII